MPSRPRIPKTSKDQRRARHAWNSGLTGKGRPAANTPVIEVCTVDGCGAPVTGQQPPAADMVQVRGAADGAAAHWYCPGRCAAIARAHADLRSIPTSPGGED